MLHTFYQSIVSSAIFYAAVCSGSTIKAGDSSRLNEVIRKAGQVISRVRCNALL